MGYLARDSWMPFSAEAPSTQRGDTGRLPVLRTSEIFSADIDLPTTSVRQVHTHMRTSTYTPQEPELLQYCPLTVVQAITQQNDITKNTRKKVTTNSGEEGEEDRSGKGCFEYWIWSLTKRLPSSALSSLHLLPNKTMLVSFRRNSTGPLLLSELKSDDLLQSLVGLSSEVDHLTSKVPVQASNVHW